MFLKVSFFENVSHDSNQELKIDDIHDWTVQLKKFLPQNQVWAFLEYLKI